MTLERKIRYHLVHNRRNKLRGLHIVPDWPKGQLLPKTTVTDPVPAVLVLGGRSTDHFEQIESNIDNALVPKLGVMTSEA